MPLTIVDADAWCCTDCTVFLANGDLTGVDYGADDRGRNERCNTIQAGAERVAAEGLHWLPNWTEDDGEDEFSVTQCACCRTRLAGRRTRWSLAADTDTVCVTTGCTMPRAEGRTRCERCLARQAETARTRRAKAAARKAKAAERKARRASRAGAGQKTGA